MRLLCYHSVKRPDAPAYAVEAAQKIVKCEGFLFTDLRHLMTYVEMINAKLRDNARAKGARVKVEKVGNDCQIFLRKGNAEGSVIACAFFRKVSGEIVMHDEENSQSRWFSFVKDDEEGGES